MLESYNPVCWVATCQEEELVVEDAAPAPLTPAINEERTNIFTQNVPLPLNLSLDTVLLVYFGVMFFLGIYLVYKLNKLEQILVQLKRPAVETNAAPPTTANFRLPANTGSGSGSAPRFRSPAWIPSLRRSLQTIFGSRPTPIKTDETTCCYCVPTKLTLHTHPRGLEAPAEIDALRIETILRILDLPHKVTFDANENSAIRLTYGDDESCLATGARHCLDFVKTFTLHSMTEWNIPEQFSIPARFILTILNGSFPGLVTVYKRGFWKGGNQFQGRELMTPSETEIAGSLEKEEILNEIVTSLDALNASLNDKHFLIGNQLTVADGFAFAILAQLAWTQDAELSGTIKKFPHLVAYTNAMRNYLWEDWTPPNFGPRRALSRNYYSDGFVSVRNRRNESKSNQRKQRSVSTRTRPLETEDK